MVSSETVDRVANSVIGIMRRWVPMVTMSADSYQRHNMVSKILVKENCRTILDVGGGPGRFFKRFLPDRESLTLDKNDGDIIGDGTNLPFGKNSFDAVTSLETLQYVKKNNRKKFVKGLIRVAKKCVIITIPTDSKELKSAEKRVNDLHKRLFGKGNYYLDKHKEIGIPTEKEIDILLKGYKVEKYSICNLKRWERIVKLNFILQKAKLLILAAILNTLYVVLMGVDSKEPTYTKIYYIKGVGK